MFNPFKKKDNGFSLDEESLPSLNEINTPSESVSQIEPDYENMHTPNLSAQNPFSTPNISPNPMATNTEISSPISDNQSSTTDLKHDLIKTKIDSLESKTNLIEAKMSNVENKLEMIYQILLEEVSDETKRKLKIDSMMGKIKK